VEKESPKAKDILCASVGGGKGRRGVEVSCYS
jgi:hypothetical protein